MADNLRFGKKLLRAVIGIAAVAELVVSGLMNAPQVHAQSPQTTSAPLPSFEVASIKPNHSGGRFRSISTSPGRFTATNEPMRVLIAWAYADKGSPWLKDEQISGGPGWINSERFDIEAKVDAAFAEEEKKLPFDQWADKVRLMVQSLLAERFKLKVSHHTKELPVYALVIAKNGAKIQESKPGDSYSSGIKRPDGVPAGARTGQYGRGQLTGQGLPMADLVRMLERQVGRPILDKTGLKGNYDFTLQWTPVDPTQMFNGAGNSSQAPPANAPPPDSSGPSIFAALQEQLGLKLESRKALAEILVIDHIERPSEN